jgi:hypothetical protein
MNTTSDSVRVEEERSDKKRVEYALLEKAREQNKKSHLI